MRNSRKSVLLVNQSVGTLFSDVISAASKYADTRLHRGISYDNSTPYARVFTWILYSLSLAIHLVLFGRKYSRILVVSNPPLAPLLAPLARQRFALLLYDLYPQVLVQLKPRSFLAERALDLIFFLWHAANSEAFTRAERIFTLSVAMADQLRPYFSSESLWRERVVVIPPWADTSKIFRQPDAAKKFRLNYQVKGFLIAYSGNIGLTHPLEPLLECCSLLEGLKVSPEIQVFLIGKGPKRNFLQQQSHKMRLPSSRICFLDPLPCNELPACLSAADLAVVALDGPSAACSLPSKTFNALACGAPILALAPIDSALAQLVHEHHCGFVIEPGLSAAHQLAELFTHLAANPTELQQISRNALLAAHHYTSTNADRLVKAWLGSLPVS